MVKEDPPLISLKVTNPVTYIKSWYQKVIGNEGIDFSFRIRPLTAITIAIVVTLILTGAGYGLGRISFPMQSQIVKYVPQLAATPTADPWRETAFTGNLKYSQFNTRYYLVTTSIEAITLEVPGNINLSAFVGKRILATGKYNKSTRTLVVSDAQDLEVLPTKALTIPTLTPVVSLAPTSVITPIPTNAL